MSSAARPERRNDTGRNRSCTKKRPPLRVPLSLTNGGNTMVKIHCNKELLETEQCTWNDWRDHFTACGQCMKANAAEAVLSRGCTRGKAIWLNWHTAFMAYSATLSRQRRTT